jgi:hypothetical protein
MSASTLTPAASVEPGSATVVLRTTDPMAVLIERRHRVTVAEFHRMCEAGIFGVEPRVELLEGVLLDKMTKGQPHVIATDLIDDLLHRITPAGYHVVMGNPLTIEDRAGEPEPDAMIVRGAIRDYAQRRRTPADAALVIEVSETSYDIDRISKWAVYAASRVAAYWILDLNQRRLEVFHGPSGEGLNAYYAQARILTADDPVPLILDGREAARFAVRDILP